MEEIHPSQRRLLLNNAVAPLGNAVRGATNNFNWEGNNFAGIGLGNSLQAAGLGPQFGTGLAISGGHLAMEDYFNLEESTAQKLEKRKNILHTARSETAALTLCR